MPLKIFEMRRDLPENNGASVLPSVPWNAEQAVDISASSVASDAFATGTRAIRVIADADCLIEFGATPTATANSYPLAAGEKEDFWVEPGHTVAVISA
jgi:hypothetical protein